MNLNLQMIKYFNILILFLIVSFIFVAPVTACDCENHQTVSNAYLYADSVIIGKVKKIVSNGKKDGFWTIQRVTVEVVKSYKESSVKKLTLLQPNSDCDWSFVNTDKKETYLFYLKLNKSAKTYTIIICGKSGKIQNVSKDLSWLNKLSIFAH